MDKILEENDFFSHIEEIIEARNELDSIEQTLKEVKKYHIEYSKIGTTDERYIECFTRKDGTINIDLIEPCPASHKQHMLWVDEYKNNWYEEHKKKFEALEISFKANTNLQKRVVKLMQLEYNQFTLTEVALRDTCELHLYYNGLADRVNELNSIINKYEDEFDEFEEYEENEEWLVNGVFPNDSLGEVFGETGSYKSFLMLDLLFCISNGIKWHGREVKQGMVLYVAGEGRRSLGRRIEALEKKYGVPKSKDFLLGQPYDLMDEYKMQKAGLAIASKGNFQMLVIDTLRRNAPSMNEKEDSHWSQARDNLETFIKPRVNVIAWVHHPTKSNNGSSGTQTRKNDSDFQYEVSKTGRKTTLKCEKLKDEEDGWKIEFELVKTLDSLTPQLYSKETNSNLSDNAIEVIKQNKLGDTFTKEEFREAVYKTYAEKKQDTKRQIFNRLLKEDGIQSKLK